MTSKILALRLCLYLGLDKGGHPVPLCKNAQHSISRKYARKKNTQCGIYYHEVFVVVVFNGCISSI